jgi:hypothetical protein
MDPDGSHKTKIVTVIEGSKINLSEKRLEKSPALLGVCTLKN